MSRRHTQINARSWAAARRACFDRDRYRCQRCGRAGRLEADHIVRLEDEPGQDPYALDGLQTLCRSCHIAKTAEKNRRPLTAEELDWQRFISELMKA